MSYQPLSINMHRPIKAANCHHHPIFEPLNSSGFVGRSLWTQKTSKKEPIRLWHFYGHVQVQKIITQSWVPRFLNLSILLQSDAASSRTAARSHKRSWPLLASAAVRRKCWWKSERSLWSRCTKSTMAGSSWSLSFERASMTSYGMYIHDHVHCVCVLYCICICICIDCMYCMYCMYCFVLYCIALHCIVLYCIVSIVVYCIFISMSIGSVLHFYFYFYLYCTVYIYTIWYGKHKCKQCWWR